MRAMVNIGDYDVPEPSTYTGTTATVVDGGRNTKAIFTGSVIREDVAKVEMTWKFISAQDWATLLSKFSSKRGGAYINSVTFFCQDTNAWETRKMYVSDRQASVFLRNKDGSIRGYTGASLSLVEA